MNSLQTVEDLYGHLMNEEGFDEFKAKNKEWEFDLEAIKDDINDEQYGDLKDDIPNALFLKIKSLINTQNDINSSIEMKRNEEQSPPSSSNKKSNIIQDAKIQKLKEQIQHEIKDENARNVIIAKIDDEQYSLDDIKDDIEDKDDSIIYDHLKDPKHQIDEAIYTQFCDIVNTLDQTDNITPNTYKPVVTPQSADNVTEVIQVTEVTDPELVKLTNLISQISDNNAAQCIIQTITEEQYEDIDSLKDDIEEKDDSMIYDHLQQNKIANIDKIFNIFCNMVNNIDDYQDIADNYSTRTSSKAQQNHICQDIEDQKVIEFIDDETHPLYQKNATIQDTISQMYIQQISKKDSTDKFKAAALTKLWCIFGPNEVQQMIDLKTRQLIITFNHTDFDKLKGHLIAYDKRSFYDPMHDFFKSEFYSRKFNKNKWDEYIQGLDQYLSLRFFGYDKLYKQIMNNHMNPRMNTINNTEDDDMDDSDDDDEDDGGYSNQLKIAWDDSYIYYDCRTVQMYCLAFFIAMTRYLLNLASNANYSVVLDMKIPIKRAEQFTHKHNEQMLFETDMDHLVLKFSQTFEPKHLSSAFERKMDEHHIACFSVDFSKSKDERIVSPVFIGKTKQDIGVDINDDDYIENYDGVHFFHCMRIKRLFSQFNTEDKASVNNRRIGIAIHKFQKTIKLYLHYECSVIRFQIEDIAQWFRILFKYHENELDLDIINRYLDKKLNDSNGYNDENEIKVNPNINYWKQLDQDFNAKHEKLKDIVRHLECMQQFQCVFK